MTRDPGLIRRGLFVTTARPSPQAISPSSATTKASAMSTAPPQPSAHAGQDRALHQSLNNLTLLESNHVLRGLAAQIGDFFSHDNCRHYHESLGNLMPAAVYSGRGETTLMKLETIKQRAFDTAACTTPARRVA